MATAATIALLAIPVVWSVGYQDHPWRQSRLAIAAGLVLIGAAVAVHRAGALEEPPVSRVLTISAIVIALGAFASTLTWAWFG